MVLEYVVCIKDMALKDIFYTFHTALKKRYTKRTKAPKTIASINTEQKALQKKAQKTSFHTTS